MCCICSQVPLWERSCFARRRCKNWFKAKRHKAWYYELSVQTNLRQRRRKIFRYAGWNKAWEYSCHLSSWCTLASPNWRNFGSLLRGSLWKLFGLLVSLYNFFLPSTHRRSILTKHLSTKKLTVKSLSETRWSARANAIAAVCWCYDGMWNCW